MIFILVLSFVFVYDYIVLFFVFMRFTVNPSVNHSLLLQSIVINVKTWDEVTLHIRARGSCVKRMTIIRKTLTKEMNSSIHITKIGKFPFQKLFIARPFF